MTARSFAHTINRLLDPKMKSGLATDFDDIVGAQKVIDGKAETAFGVIARGDTLTIRLKKPDGAFAARAAGLCVVPEGTPIDPEGVKAPAPSAGPYYFAEFVLGQRVVLKRNRFYRGDRPHHVDRFVVNLTLDEASVLDRVERNELDYGWVPAVELRRARGRAPRQVRDQQVPLLGHAGEQPADVRPQHEQAAVPQQPQAEAGDQLRRQSQVAARASAAHSAAR